MDFSDDECICILINLYKWHPILWDPSDPKYKLSKLKIDYWLEIANEMGKDVISVKKKMESLPFSF